MQTIRSLTSEPRQSHIIPIEGGYDDATLLLEFKETQYAWYMTLTWGAFSVANMRVACSPNLLGQYKSTFPFGLLVDSDNLQDPLTLESFSTEMCRISILSEAEVAQVDALYYGT